MFEKLKGLVDGMGARGELEHHRDETPVVPDGGHVRILATGQ